MFKKRKECSKKEKRVFKKRKECFEMRKDFRNEKGLVFRKRKRICCFQKAKSDQLTSTPVRIGPESWSSVPLPPGDRALPPGGSTWPLLKRKEERVLDFLRFLDKF